MLRLGLQRRNGAALLPRVGAVLRAEPYLLVAPVLILAAGFVLIQLPWRIDLGIHAATLQRWLHDPTPDVHPLIEVPNHSPYYSPYMGLWTLVGHLLGLPVLHILRFAGLANVIIMVGGLWYAVRGITSRTWAPVLAVVTCGVVWGVESRSWSGFFSLVTVTFSMPFPSFFATAVGLWLWGVALRCGRSRSVSLRQASVMAVLAAIVALSHQFTAAGFAVLVGLAALAPLARRGWEPGARVRYLLRWLLTGLGALALCLLWPFYSVTDLFGDASAFDALSEAVYLDPLHRYTMLFLALPAVVVRARRKGLADPLVLAAVTLLAITVAAGATERFWLGRLIPHAVITIQIIAAVELASALGRRRPERLGAGWRAAAIVPTAVAIVFGLWAQAGVISTLWPGSLPERPFDARVGLLGRYDWATRHMAYGDTVLTSHATALRMVPAYGPFTVASPYPEPLIADEQAQRLADTRRFFDHQTDDSTRAEILDRYEVEWVIESTSTWRPSDTEWGRRTFEKVDQRGRVVVYQVRR